MTFDLVIKNGTVLSFIPEPIFNTTDIGICGNKIVSINSNEIQNSNYNKLIDAKGCIVSPGFIDFHSHVNCNPIAAKQLVLQGATTTIGGKRVFDGKLMEKVAREGFLMNHGFFLSHSFTLRYAVGLSNPYLPASDEELTGMLELAEIFFKSGSLGLFFGLEMVPGTSKKEIIELSRLAKKYNKKVLIHLRKDGSEGIASLKEAIDIARLLGVSIHLLNLTYMVGHLDTMQECLSIIDNAIKEGLDITADTGLYEAFPAYIGSSILDPGWESHYIKPISYRDVLISSGIYNGNFCSPKNFEFLRQNFPNTLVTVFAFDEKASEMAIKKDYVYISTNAADGPVYTGIGHPETAGTFPKLIRKYVRQNNVISLKDALYKITYGPAVRFGISNKGNIKKDYDADIVIFKYDEIRDTATFSNVGAPDSPPLGIKYVIINGKIVVSNGELTDNLTVGKYISV